MKTPAIAISSTRQWNPGDEFILMGVRRVLSEAIGLFHPILFNRNPMLRGLGTRREWLDRVLKRTIGKGLFPTWIENSLSERHPPGLADIAVFAGSPEWTGARAQALYEIVARDHIPVVFLGLGSQSPRHPEDFTALEKDALQRASLITARDALTRDALIAAGLTCKPLCPCPALFSAPEERPVTFVKRVALGAVSRITQGQRVGDDLYEFIEHVYPRLEQSLNREGIECVYVAHHVDDLASARAMGKNVFYSYDAADYVSFYPSVDFVVTPRVHGIGLAASCGVPGAGLAHDPRADTMQGFLAPVFSVAQGEEYIQASILSEIRQAPKRSRELILHKHACKAELIAWIKEALPEYAV